MSLRGFGAMLLERFCRFPMHADPTQTFALLRDWHQGDRQALDRLLERDLPWVRDYVRRRIGGLLSAKADPDDFVQEAAIQAMQYAPRFTMSDREQFRALLARITENVIRDKVQRLKTDKRNVARERPTPSDSLLHLDPPVGTITRPSQAAERNEERLWIRLAIDLLDPEERSLLLWREWQGMSFGEIAERMGIKEDTARMRFNRALPKLARKVQELRQGKLDGIVADIDSPD